MKLTIQRPGNQPIDVDTDNKDIEITVCISKFYYYSTTKYGNVKYKNCYNVYVVYDGNGYKIASFNYKLSALIYKYKILRDIKRAMK